MHRLTLGALALVVAAAMAGCHGPDVRTPAEGDSVRLMGWFTEYNETIQADFDATVGPYSDNVLMMESFPPGFQILDLDPDACPELRAQLVDKDYLRNIGDCERPPPADDSDDQVSSDDP